jgi:hypothetical protein
MLPICRNPFISLPIEFNLVRTFCCVQSLSATFIQLHWSFAQTSGATHSSATFCAN